MVSAMGRMRGRGSPATPGSAALNGRRTLAMSEAATRKLMASATNAALRPKATVNAPPRLAPIASIAPHVADIIAVAVGRSSGSTRFGTAACDAGPKNAPRNATAAWATNANHTVPWPMSSHVRAATAWSADITIMSDRRSNRSAAGPASGAATNWGRVAATNTPVAARSEWVRWSSSPISATLANQSPP